MCNLKVLKLSQCEESQITVVDRAFYPKNWLLSPALGQGIWTRFSLAPHTGNLNKSAFKSSNGRGLGVEEVLKLHYIYRTVNWVALRNYWVGFKKKTLTSAQGGHLMEGPNGVMALILRLTVLFWPMYG